MQLNTFEAFAMEQQFIRLNRADTPFPCYYLASKQLWLHFIPLDLYFTINPEKNLLHHVNINIRSGNEKVIHIWEDIWKQHQQTIINRIHIQLGKGKKIFARKCECTRIDKQAAHSFLLQHHLLRPTNAYYKLALQFEKENIAVATFSKSRIMYDGPTYYRSYELERFATKSDCVITAGLSKIISCFVHQTSATHIMTYTDNDWGTGEGFKQAGFNPVEVIPHQLFYYDTSIQKRILLADAQTNVNPNLHKLYTSGSTKYVLHL